MRCSHEEGSAELPLEAVQARCEGGLGNEKSLSGAAHAATARHLEETLDLNELNAPSLAVTGFLYGFTLRKKFYL